jgi:hypothetical protein
MRDDRKVTGVKDTAHNDGVVVASHGGTLPIPASRRRRPHGGRQLSLPIRRLTWAYIFDGCLFDGGIYFASYHHGAISNLIGTLLVPSVFFKDKAIKREDNLWPKQHST